MNRNERERFLSKSARTNYSQWFLKAKERQQLFKLCMTSKVEELRWRQGAASERIGNDAATVKGCHSGKIKLFVVKVKGFSINLGSTNDPTKPVLISTYGWWHENHETTWPRTSIHSLAPSEVPRDSELKFTLRGWVDRSVLHNTSGTISQGLAGCWLVDEWEYEDTKCYKTIFYRRFERLHPFP